MDLVVALSRGRHRHRFLDVLGAAVDFPALLETVMVGPRPRKGTRGETRSRTVTSSVSSTESLSSASRRGPRSSPRGDSFERGGGRRASRKEPGDLDLSGRRRSPDGLTHGSLIAGCPRALDLDLERAPERLAGDSSCDIDPGAARSSSGAPARAPAGLHARVLGGGEQSRGNDIVSGRNERRRNSPRHPSWLREGPPPRLRWSVLPMRRAGRQCRAPVLPSLNNVIEAPQRRGIPAE